MNKKSFQHIILISLDTLRADCIGASPLAYNFLNKYKINFKLKTQGLDDILNNGFYFNNCISTAPYTSASHASYFTGFWPVNHGVYEFFNRKINKPTIFEYAKQSGYRTIFQTDFPIILGKYLGFTRSIDRYYIEEEKAALNQLINTKEKTLSFFHFGGIHYPYGFHNLKFGGKDYLRKINILEKKYKIKKNKKIEDVLDESFRSTIDRKLLLRYKAIVEMMYKKKLYDDLFSLYLEGINYFFKKRFNDFLKKIKFFVDNHNALLIIFSDHGEAWDKDSYGHHNSLSDETLRVPLIFYGKGVQRKVVHDMIRTIDLAPTIIDLLEDSKIKIKMDGKRLNIFNYKKQKFFKKYAIAQVWKVGDKYKLYDYQKKVSMGKNIKPLKTFLDSEMAYDGKYKLIRFYNQNRYLINEIFLFKKGENFVRSQNKRKTISLRKTLKNYNNLFKNNVDTVKEIPVNLKRGLQILGYKI